jgi:heme-degrading monooxygenase HmoA
MNRDIQTIKERINSEQPVYTATFTFRIKAYDSEFEELNNLIDQAAQSNDGFLGKESWSNEELNKKSVIYYWNSLENLRVFSRNPVHQKAKQNYSKWYSGYEVIISEVLNLKSDDRI